LDDEGGFVAEASSTAFGADDLFGFGGGYGFVVAGGG